MQKQTIFLEVNQTIEDFSTNQQEQWKHETKGELYQLTSFNKLTYQGIDQLDTVIKWYNDSFQRLEIVYGKNRLYFNLDEQTDFNYQIDNGKFDLLINTKRLEITAGSILLDYELVLEEKPIGYYEFRLIYHV